MTFAGDDTFQAARLPQIQDDDRHMVVHAQRQGRAVEHADPQVQRVDVGQPLEPFGLRIYERIAAYTASTFVALIRTSALISMARKAAAVSVVK